MAVYAKRMALVRGDEPVHFSMKEDWFDSFELVEQWLQYNEELTSDDLPAGRKVLEISCVLGIPAGVDANRFIESTIDSMLSEFYRDGGRPGLGDPAAIPWGSSSDELDDEEVVQLLARFPSVGTTSTDS
ncbi:hypothetical protein [Nocardia nova]|uniref:hypothetical protein n=1 Tax=Nocardia nova TaxID=37330 RepID=UPI0033D8B32C